MSSESKVTFYCLLLFLLLIIVFITLNGRMGNDEGIWTYIARAWVDHGILPYKGAIDDKPAGIILLHSISYTLFGINYWFPRVLGALSILITGFVLFRLNTIHYGKKSGLIGMCIFCLTMPWSFMNSHYTGQTEVFMVLFSSLAFFLVFRKHQLNLSFQTTLLAGIFIGLAISFKQVAGLSLIALLIILLKKEGLTRSSFIKSFFLLIAALFSFGLIHWPVLNKVNLNNYLTQVWLSPTIYPSFLWRIPNFFDSFVTSRFAIFYPFLLFGWFNKNNIGYSNYLRAAALWLFMAFLGVNISGYYYGHQFSQIIPALSLISGVITAFGINHINKQFKPAFVAILALFIPYSLLIGIASSILSSDKSLRTKLNNHLKGDTEAKAVGEWIREQPHCDYIFNFGVKNNAILSYSGKKSASRFLSPRKTLKKQKQIIHDLQDKQPKYIVKRTGMNHDYEVIEKYLTRHYTIQLTRHKWKIFKRKAKLDKKNSQEIGR